MEILNFKNFITEEVQIKVFDLVIDEMGQIIYKGQLPMKGNLDTSSKRIVGDDQKEYIAAIDRTGKLFSYLPVDEKGNILLNGKKVKTKQIDSERSIRTKRTYWNTNENYTILLPILPTGLVNVKIDMEVIKNIRRYSTGITNRTGVEGLKQRLNLLSKHDTKLRRGDTKSIRKEMSGIMTLHYLKELKGHFDPSSSGFLFESYIAGMITGSTVREDNSPIDVQDSKGNTYQIKLLDSNNKSMPSITLDENNNFLSYYLVSFKYHNKIRIFLLSGKDEDIKKENYVLNFRANTKYVPTTAKEGKKLEDYRNFSHAKFKQYENKSAEFIYDLYLLDIDERIERIAEGLKESIEGLYNNLSKFQYNVETILTGVNEKGKLLKDEEFVKIENESFTSLTNMKRELDGLIGIVKRS